LVHAGKRSGQPMDIVATLEVLLDCEEPDPQTVADGLLENACRLDQNRPSDDISVAVLRVASMSGDEVRRMTVRLPLD